MWRARAVYYPSFYPSSRARLRFTIRTESEGARAARSEQATKANATTRAGTAEIRRAGKSTLAAIAQELEVRGVPTPAAGRDRWGPAKVSLLLAALGFPLIRKGLLPSR